MKILFITEKLPYPLDSGGNIRSYHILKGLSQEHSVTLVSTIVCDEQRKFEKDLKKICDEIITIKVKPETKFKFGAKIIKSIISSVPIVIERHYYHEMASAIKQIFLKKSETKKKYSSSGFDVVHFNHLDATIYQNLISRCTLKVLDGHNVVTNQIKTLIPYERNLVKHLYMISQLRKTENYEIDMCNKMTKCFVCSDRDKQYLSDMIKNTNIVAIPNGVDIDFFSSNFCENNLNIIPPKNSKKLIFIGTLDYGPCEKAVYYFCTEILPLIEQKISEIQFIAVGRNPSKRIRTLAKRKSNIILTGWVEDVRPYIHTADIFVVPLLSGSGTRLKILDAMAMRIPVVSTTIGAEGLEVKDGESILIADSPYEFLSAVEYLLQNNIRAKTIVKKAFNLAKKQYSWQVISKKVLSQYKLMEDLKKVKEL